MDWSEILGQRVVSVKISRSTQRSSCLRDVCSCSSDWVVTGVTRLQFCSMSTEGPNIQGFVQTSSCFFVARRKRFERGLERQSGAMRSLIFLALCTQAVAWSIPVARLPTGGLVTSGSTNSPLTLSRTPLLRSLRRENGGSRRGRSVSHRLSRVCVRERFVQGREVLVDGCRMGAGWVQNSAERQRMADRAAGMRRNAEGNFLS